MSFYLCDLCVWLSPGKNLYEAHYLLVALQVSNKQTLSMAELGYNTKAKIPKGHLQGIMHGSVLEVSVLLSLPCGRGHCLKNKDSQCENIMAGRRFHVYMVNSPGLV